MATNRRGGGRLPGNGDFAAMAARGRGKGSFTRIVLPVASFFFSCGFVLLGFVASGIGSFVSAEGVMLLRVGTELLVFVWAFCSSDRPERWRLSASSIRPISAEFFFIHIIISCFLGNRKITDLSVNEIRKTKRVPSVFSDHVLNELRKTKTVSSVFSNHVFINSEFLRLRSYFSERFVTLFV
jgi:hypothetical protein